MALAYDVIEIPNVFGAISASYNYEEDIDKRVMTQVANERRAGKEFVNHLILRDNKDNRYNLKFNIPMLVRTGSDVVALPFCAFVLWSMNAHLKKIGMVGDKNTCGKIHSKVVDYANYYRKHKGLEERINLFAHEGEPEEWSMANTMNKLIEVLDLKSGDKTNLIPADTSYADPRHIAADPDLKKVDALFRLNTKEITGMYYFRNYHYAAKYYTAWDMMKHVFSKEEEDWNGKRTSKFKPKPSKEPNPIGMDLVRIKESAFGLELSDLWHGARKSYDGKNKQVEVVKKMLFYKPNKENKEYKFALGKTLSIAAMIMSQPDLMYETARYMQRKKKELPEDENKLLSLNVDFARKILKKSVGLDVIFKPSQDPGGVMDFDSYEDTIFNQAMIQLIQDKKISLNTIFPYFDDITQMGLEIGKWGVELTDNWLEVANNAFDKFGIKARYEKNGMLEQKIFSNERLEGQIRLMQDYWKDKKIINE
ncbi:hypothetical protein JW756_00685 [Candidatus Woesearchaeota archaeon]|nr:hypothetical protein [Candidatus Woesearchaeota archaeon]